MSAAGVGVLPGCRHFPGWFDASAQAALVAELRGILTEAPLFRPLMPRTGTPFSVRMSNCGPLGWVSDLKGYRYQPLHPETGRPWPPMPAALLALWQAVSDGAASPEACLINWYEPDAKMGLHQDRDERDFSAPIVSVSLGDDAIFRMGGTMRGGKTVPITLRSGDVLVFGGPARLAFHGITKIMPGTSLLLEKPGRINLTLRRVNP